MTSVEEILLATIYELELSLEDAKKADKGNKSAGVRVRKVAYNSIFKLKNLRGRILTIRKEGVDELDDKD